MSPISSLIRPRSLEPLTSLRFFAAAMIVTLHADELFGSAGIATTFSLGQGVTFFFVLSGFILSYNYPTLDNWGSIGKFWLARIARIWPAHIIAILFAVLVTGTTNTYSLSSGQTVIAAIANIFLVQAWIPFRDYFFSFNSVAWSISTEFFFYLMFPLLLLNLRKTWGWTLFALMAVVTINILSGALWNIPATESAQSLSLAGLLYINPLNRILEFYLGILACQVYFRYNSKIIVSAGLATVVELAVLALAIFSLWFTLRVSTLLGWQGQFFETLNHYLTRSGGASSFFAVILVFALQRGFVSSLLSHRFLLFLGEISFSLYLVHRTVLEWFRIDANEWISAIPKWSAYILYWLSSLLMAYFLYSLVEKPCQRIIRGFSTIRSSEIGFILLTRKQMAMWGSVFLLIFFTVYWHPGKPCAEAECNDLWRQATYHDIAAFQNVASLQAMLVVPTTDSLELKMLWKVTGDTSGMTVGIHAVDEKGGILWQHDYLLIHSQGLTKGRQWIDTIKIPKKSITNQWVGLGFAVYKVPTTLTTVQASKSDWGGTRALLIVKEFQSASVYTSPNAPP